MLHTLKGHRGEITAFSLSADGATVVSAGGDRRLFVWEVKTGRHIATLAGHTDAVRACAFSPDGRRVVSASTDESLILWDCESWTALASMRGFTGGLLSCAFSPDGRSIVYGNHLGAVALAFLENLDMSPPRSGPPRAGWRFPFKRL